MKPEVSILISSHNRLALLRRTLWAIARRPPSRFFEVVVCDDGSDEDVLGELKRYSSAFLWKFIRFDAAAFEQHTGLKKFHNNPAVTNNIACRHAEGDYLFQQGNEVIAWADCYDRLLGDAPGRQGAWMVMSTTYDLRQDCLEQLDDYGSNLDDRLVAACLPWPLQSHHYRSDVTNYISLAPRWLWQQLGGYDERYYGGISAEDSDFVRRARTLPGFQQVISAAVSLHQYHQGKTCYYDPPPRLISKARWQEGCAINRAIYDAWDGTSRNPQSWPWGSIGVGEVLSNAL